MGPLKSLHVDVKEPSVPYFRQILKTNIASIVQVPLTPVTYSIIYEISNSTTTLSSISLSTRPRRIMKITTKSCHTCSTSIAISETYIEPFVLLWKEDADEQEKITHIRCSENFIKFERKDHLVLTENFFTLRF